MLEVVQRLLGRLRYTLVNEGLWSTMARATRYVQTSWKRRRYESMLRTRNMTAEERFTWVYENRIWNSFGSNESVSGVGSTLECTANLRTELPKLLEEYSIKTLLDAPCGDFNWMRHVLPETDVVYIGGDIVAPLVQRLQQSFSSARISFRHLDLLTDDLPPADLLLCRDCLFHLSYSDTRRFFANFLRSNIPYLLTTTHDNTDGFVNKDIPTGDFRRIDLTSAPYLLPRESLRTIVDFVPPEPSRSLQLWHRDQLTGVFPEGS